MLFGTVMTFFGLIGSSMATGIFQLYITFGVISGVGVGVILVPCISILGAYFDKRRAFAIGVAASGIGLGSIIYPPLVQYLVDEYGWRGSLLILAGIMLNLGPVTLVLKPKPKKEVEEESVKPQERSLSDIIGCVIFTKYRFTLMCIGGALMSFGFNIVYVHVGTYAWTVGIDEDDSAILYSTMGISNFLGRLVFGILCGSCPRFPKLPTYIISIILVGIPVTCIPFLHSFAEFLVVSVLFGFLTGVIGPITPEIYISFLGLDKFSTGVGYGVAAEGIGCLLGAPAAGWLYDVTQTFSYSFYLSGAIIILSKVILLPALKPMSPSPGPVIVAEEGWLNSNLLLQPESKEFIVKPTSPLEHQTLGVPKSFASLGHLPNLSDSLYNLSTRPTFLFGSDIITVDRNC